MAAAEVQYANGSAGHAAWASCARKTAIREPYGVKCWSVGNEMYGDWQLGHMPLEQYVQKHNRVAEAMRAVDPAIKLVAVGDVGHVERGDAPATAPTTWT